MSENMQEQNRNTNNNQNKPPFRGGNNKNKFNSYWIPAVIGIAFFAIYLVGSGNKEVGLKWKDFRKMMLDRHVERIVIINQKKENIYIKTEFLDLEKYRRFANRPFNALSGSRPYYVMEIPAERFMDQLDEIQTDFSEEEKIYPEFKEEHNYLGEIFSWLVPIIILVAIWIFIIRRMSGSGAGGGAGNIFNVGKSKAKIFDKESNIKIDFKDVAGLEEAKMEVKEIVDFLKKPKKYTELGGKIPKGALLVGPPGTGKTLLAKAVAGEANVPFFSISGSDFVEMFVGVGASRVRDLFKQAKEKAPCIVFIDEIDAIGRARGRNPNMGANDERENTLNQLLTEMDGFGTNVGVIILAATNRADILDRALLRAGRFDRQIHVELPDYNERKEIFKVHLKPIKIDEKLDVEFLAKQTPGFSGADIANVCNEAALIAARKNKKSVEKQDFLDSIDRIIGGLERKNKIITMKEKRTIAFHEAGHATLSWLLEHAHPLVKVTIIPRGKALGAAWYLPEERQITTREQLLDDMCATLGGRASEKIMFGELSTGALNDLERITKQAYAMVTYFGLSNKIGNRSFYDSTGQSDYSFTKPYSEKTAEDIDNEVNNIIEEQFERAQKILKENQAGLTRLAELLLEKEVIFSEDLENIFGKRKKSEDETKLIEKNNGNKNKEVKERVAKKEPGDKKSATKRKKTGQVSATKNTQSKKTA